MSRLRAFVTPIKELWQTPDLTVSVESFETFCNLLGLGKVREFLISRRVHEVQDWGTFALDAEGQALQADLNERVKVSKLAMRTITCR
jgi:exportin-5